MAVAPRSGLVFVSCASLAAIVMTSACRRAASTDLTPAPVSDENGEASPPPPVIAATTLAPVASVASGAPAAFGLKCARDATFPSVLAVPEASGAAEVVLRPGTHELLVVSDSDNQGAALAYTLPEGPSRPLSLPLDPKASDDIEGIAWYGGRVYALASTGFVERFTPDGKGGLRRDGDAYGLGGAPYTSNAKFLQGTPPDFEGLCLRPKSARAPREDGKSRCAGYAASRAYGWLVCLRWNGDRLGVDPDRPRIALDVRKRSLSDCAFGDEGGPGSDVLLVTTNIFGGSTVYRVDENSGALAPLDVEGTASNEAVAIDHDGRLYQLMDANSATSSATRATCTGW